MTIWEDCPSTVDRVVAAQLRDQADVLASLPPAARNPAPGTPASPEAEQARAELARLAALRRSLGAFFDAGVPVTAPWAEGEIAAAALDWLHRIDPADLTALEAAARRIDDPLRTFRDGGRPQIDLDSIGVLRQALDDEPGIDIDTLLDRVRLDVRSGLMRVGRQVLAQASVAPDAGVEVLVPLRIETRFLAPTDQRANWLLRLRVYPDEVSIARPPAPPSADELDRLDEALAGPYRDPAIDEAAAFGGLASAVGAARAAWLLRSTPIDQPDRSKAPLADRALVAAPRTGPPTPHGPAGLPPAIDVWAVPRGGAPQRVHTLEPLREEIAGDLTLDQFVEAAPGGELPTVWWTSFVRATEVGLGADIELGPDVPDLEAIVVSGLGDSAPDALLDAHAASGRLAILAPGTATNTVAGDTTTELGRDPDAWRPLAARTGIDETATSEVLRALTGRDDPTAPLLGGFTDVRGPAGALVEALWPALWGRAIRDVAGAGPQEDVAATWASRHLCAEGPYAAIRVGEQPYGLLPVTSLGGWVANDGDPVDEDRLCQWAIRWRDEAAAFGEAHGTAAGADSERLLALLGDSAPSRRWAARAVLELPYARALHAYYGVPAPEATRWDKDTADALARSLAGFVPIAPVGPALTLPEGREAPPETLRKMFPPKMTSEQLLVFSEPLGLLGHLLRGSLLIAHALVGLAVGQLPGGIDPARGLSLSDPNDFLNNVFRSTRGNVDQLEQQGGEAGAIVVGRFRSLVRAMDEVVARYELDPERMTAALHATLDAAAFRVDPWAMGIADRRRSALAADAPYRLGAYGWVDAPRPYDGAQDGPLAPGPTAAGLLHAPSPTQALTAALLRDAAVRHPGDDRWQLTIDSARVRAAARLAERVRLGVHPYEALGLEVERLVGDWEAVRVLRGAFPLRGDGDGRRCCDGRRVLAALLRGEEPLPPGLPGDLADRVAPLDRVLDTYGDLLVADGIHAMVSGRSDLANAAMEAAAGLGAPPELRAIRTPRSSSGVAVAVLAALPVGPAPGPDAGPAVAADPAFAALLDDELGPPSAWTWDVAGAGAVTLADAGLHGAELLDTPAAELAALLGAGAAATVSSGPGGGGELLERARALAMLLGSSEDDAPMAGSVTGTGGLDGRLAELVSRARALAAALPAMAAGDGLAALARWRIDPIAEDPEQGPAGRVEAGVAELLARIDAAAGAPATGVAALRAAIRALTGHRGVPVVAVGPLATGLVAAPGLDGEWLEIVAAVRPRLAALEARQLTPGVQPWPGAVLASDGSGDPWAATDAVTVAYGPGIAAGAAAQVALVALDAWVDSIPSRRHATSAAFGFNGPKSRAPQALLLAVPPDLSHRTTAEELRDAVLETRSLVRARAARPDARWERVATPAPLLPDVGNRFVPLLSKWAPQ